MAQLSYDWSDDCYYEVGVKLDDAAMKAIAEKSGGRYVRFATAQTTDTSLGDIYRDFLRQVAVKEQNEAGEHLGERYQWFLVPSITLSVSVMPVSARRTTSATWRIFMLSAALPCASTSAIEPRTSAYSFHVLNAWPL